MTPTTEQLKDLLAKVTPAPWWTDAVYRGREMGCAIIAANEDCGPLPGNPTRGLVAWSSAVCNTDARRCEANARIIAIAPELARKVIAAEKLAEALRNLTDTYANMEDGNGEPCPDVISGKKALTSWDALK